MKQSSNEPEVIKNSWSKRGKVIAKILAALAVLLTALHELVPQLAG
jgi:hypothetical protein